VRDAETVLVTDTTRGHRDTGAPVGSLTVLDTRLLDDWGRRLAVVLHLICLAAGTAEPEPAP